MIKRVDKKYRAWIVTQLCVKCDFFKENYILPAHQRILGGGGTALKPPDKDALPMCKACHGAEHDGAVTFWGQGTKAKTKIYVQKLCDSYIKKYKEEQNGFHR